MRRFSHKKRATSTRDAHPVPPCAPQDELSTDAPILILEPPYHFNLRKEGERIRLIDSVWAANADVIGQAAIVNPEIAALLESITTNSYKERGLANERSLLAHQDGLLLNLARCKNRNVTTVLTAMNSVVLHRACTPETVWKMLTAFAPGLFMSDTWTAEFVLSAKSQRPPPVYDVIPGVGGCCFDNYQRDLVYAAMMVNGESGTKLDMNANGSFGIPRDLASPNFDAKSLCKTCCPLLSCPPAPTCTHHQSLCGPCPGCHFHRLCPQFSMICGDSRGFLGRLSSPNLDITTLGFFVTSSSGSNIFW